ncbi:MAG TPA: RluA family pseudouridine synthase [Malonomonas sp.]
MEPFQQLLFPMDHSPVRLDSFLAESLPEVSRSQLKKLIEANQVLVDGRPAKAGVKLKGGEQIGVSLPEPEPIDAIPEALPLSILYEDKYLIVIDKAAGMVVHPAAGHARGTLVNALLHHCTDLAGIGGELRPGIVHRIDKDTSGVMVATKDDQSHQFLAAQFKKHSVNRRYLALVHGLMKEQIGTIDQPIGRHPVQRKKISSNTKHGKRAVTHWKVLRRYDADHLTLVELSLETGRTHQIRVHLSEMAHPLVADPLYTSSTRKKNLADARLRKLIDMLPGQALHARDLGFVHPASHESMDFRSELPSAFQAIIDYLEQKYSAAASEARKQS